MVKKLTKHGNSHALVIERPIMDLLKIDAETPLEVSTDGTVLIVTPVRDEKRHTKFKDALQKTNKKYARMLKNLAR